MLQRISPKRDLQLAPETLSLLQHYAFPGNIRELRNILERASLLTDGKIILPTHLPASCQHPVSDKPMPEEDDIISLEENERRYLMRVLASSPDDRTALAKRLGLSKRTLYRKLQALQNEGV